jgi:hypothetical protein
VTVYIAGNGEHYDTAVTYRVDGKPGIAFRVVGLERAYDYDDGEWLDTGHLRMRAVGDLHIWVIDPDDVTPIADDAFCPSCGSTLCQWH